MITYLRYVPHALIEAYSSLGWVMVDDFAGTSHGLYAILMKWAAEGEPKEPQKD